MNSVLHTCHLSSIVLLPNKAEIFCVIVFRQLRSASVNDTRLTFLFVVCFRRNMSGFFVSVFTRTYATYQVATVLRPIVFMGILIFVFFYFFFYI